MATLSGDKKYVTVQKGDTLSEIARDYGNGTTYQQLAAINGIGNPDLIYVGQKIYLSKTGSSSSNASTGSQTVTIKQFGLQADVENVLFVTWGWTKSNTENYQVRWEYYTKDKVWFVGSDDTTTYKYSTYSIPSNATQVRVRVKPVSKKKKENNKEVSYWTGSWSSWSKHTVERTPDTPPVPTVTLKDFTITAEVSNLKGEPSIVQFDVVKDDGQSIKMAKASVSTSSASYSCTIVAGSKYKVRCRAYKDGVWGEWSNYSNNVDTIPSTPTALTKCEPKSENSIYLEWPSITNATSYEIEYAIDKTHFEGSDKVTSKTGITTNSYELSSGIESEKEYFFRVRAVNGNGNSGWSEVSSTIIGKGPAAPTTWSSTTTAIVGESLNLYWSHNAQDGSSQTYAHLEVKVDGVVMIDKHIENTASGDDKDKTSVYPIDTSSYSEGAKLQWRVRTAGISKVYGEWSIQRVVDIYAPPVLELSVTNSIGENIEVLESFPFQVSALAGPNTQRPIGYHLSVTSNEAYETVDILGNSKIVNEGEQIYSKHFDISEKLSVELSAGDLNLENNVQYTITCSVAMDSGLTAQAFTELTVAWTEIGYTPNAEIGVDEDTFSTYIRPYCAVYNSVYYIVNRVDHSNYMVTEEVIDAVYGEPVPNAFTATGNQVFYGTTADGVVTYYCIVEEMKVVEDVLMSVYRREFDGSFTELASGLDGAKNTFITDPHPALDYARYRIVATSKDTGTVAYYDPPGYPVGCKAVIIQWDEKWAHFDSFGNEDALEQPSWSGSLLKLPYNIDISDKHASDVALVAYIGRKRPVSYYGTQLGETATWNMEIEKDDKETLYALRRLSVWTGDVYIREPSGSGYWANIRVSFSQKHLELTIPVTIEVTRVEGGV